ncbi:MAG: hypothetical protein AB7E95_03920 [Kiritimatiellales bacterium]
MFSQDRRDPSTDDIEIVSFKKLILYPSRFALGRRIFEYSEVLRLYCNVKQVSEGFGYTTYAKVLIYTNKDKHPLKIQHKAQLSAKKVMPMFWSAYNVLQDQTRQYRARYYQHQLEQKGFFDYDRAVRITKAGTIERRGIAVCVSVARDKGLLQIGTEYGFQGDNYKKDPLEVIISESGFGVFQKKIKFHIHYDADIMTSLLSGKDMLE